jgi:hypothetical protein
MRREPTSLDVSRIKLVAKRLIDDHDFLYPTLPTLRGFAV